LVPFLSKKSLHQLIELSGIGERAMYLGERAKSIFSCFLVLKYRMANAE
jgi:hypothetical protein